MKRRCLARAIVGVLLVSVAAVVPSYADEGVDSVTLRDAPGWVLVSSTVLEHGTVVKQWSDGARTVGVAAAPGSVVDSIASSASGLLGASVSTPATDKSADDAPILDSLVSMVEALGMPRVDAHRVFGPVDAMGLVLGASSDVSKLGNTVIGPLTDTTDSPQPRSNVCLSLTGHEGKVRAYGCDQQIVDHAKKGDWYLADKFLLSGTSTDSGNWFAARLTSLRAKTTYPSDGNLVLEWDPPSTKNVGDCQNESTSVSDTKSGVSHGTSSQVCPNTFGPWVVRATEFGSRWDGRQPAANFWESTNGTMYTHNPPRSSPTYTFRVEMSWER